MMTISEFEPNVRIFYILLDFYVVNDSTPQISYFSYMHSTPLNKLIFFQKNPSRKNFDQNHWIFPTLTLIPNPYI